MSYLNRYRNIFFILYIIQLCLNSTFEIGTDLIIMEFIELLELNGIVFDLTKNELIKRLEIDEILCDLIGIEYIKRHEQNIILMDMTEDEIKSEKNLQLYE